jgi:hypothetical protein
MWKNKINFIEINLPLAKECAANCMKNCNSMIICAEIFRKTTKKNTQKVEKKHLNLKKIKIR